MTLSDKARRLVCRVRLRLSRTIQVLILGPTAGRMPRISVSSIEELAYATWMAARLHQVIEVHGPAIENYPFPPTFPSHFRRHKTLDTKKLFHLSQTVVNPHSGLAWIRNRANRAVLAESVGSLFRIMSWDDALWEIMMPVRREHITGSILSCPPLSYFHWVLEILPNLLYALDKVKDVRVLLPSRVPKYVTQSMELTAKYRAAPIRTVISDRPVLPERLVLPQMGVSSGFVHRDVLHVLRNTFIRSDSPKKAPSAQKLYVSRLHTPGRKLANENELIDRLSPLGFCVMYPETMPFEDQITAFHNATLVVAPHGAGLTNITWCKPGCRVVELFPSHYFNDCYARLAMALELSYSYIVCTEQHATHGTLPIHLILEHV